MITRENMIQNLKRIAPIITDVMGTEDMGYEFSAVVPEGVIYAEPGMLLGYSNGEWPPNTWENKTDADFEVLLKDFLLHETWRVSFWENLSDEEIEQWFEDATNTEYANRSTI